MKAGILSIACLATLLAGIAPAEAIVIAPPAQAASASPAEQVTYRHGFVARGPRGGVVAGRTVVRPPVRPVHPIHPVRPVPAPVRPWVRPSGYWWRPGAAVAAGAAIGFATAAAATAWATTPAPAPNYCWYYTNASRTSGFWDVCPR